MSDKKGPDVLKANICKAFFLTKLFLLPSLRFVSLYKCVTRDERSYKFRYFCVFDIQGHVGVEKKMRRQAAITSKKSKICFSRLT